MLQLCGKNPTVFRAALGTRQRGRCHSQYISVRWRNEMAEREGYCPSSMKRPDFLAIPVSDVNSYVAPSCSTLQPIFGGAALLAVKPLRLLSVHDVTLGAQENMQPAIAEPALLGRQLA